MVQLTTFPSMEDLEKIAATVPEYMHPNTMPSAVILEGYFLPRECDNITDSLLDFESYKYSACGAKTRDCGDPLVMFPIKNVAVKMNQSFWNYDIDEGATTWMQTYHAGGYYDLHADSAPGRVRKLTAVTMLSADEDYQGGVLTVYLHPEKIEIPKTQGTVVIFQSHLLHEVSRVIDGVRHTTNTGFFGPPFR